MSVLERSPSNRENSYGKMTENRQGPTPGVRLREVFVKRELTVFTFSRTLPQPDPWSYIEVYKITKIVRAL